MATEIRLLGPIEAFVDGRPAHLGQRPRAVLAVLALHAGHVVPVTRLVDAVWGDHPPDTAANVLQGYVSQLRKTLGRELVETRDHGYLLRGGRPSVRVPVLVICASTSSSCRRAPDDEDERDDAGPRLTPAEGGLDA